MNETVYQVAVEAPLPEALSYLPPVTSTPLQRGQSVRVPLGQRHVRGVVLGPRDQALQTSFELKPILEKDEERPVLAEPFLQWTGWLSEYYIHPHGQILESVFPPLKRYSKRKSRKASVIPEVPRTHAPPLTPDQLRCLEEIESHRGFRTHLLHGVTGSGKTEVYLNLLNDVISNGDQALVLVPEISLTPQLIERFSGRFPNQVAVIHSHLTEREKTDQWWAAVSGERAILIGARSALFCPLPRLKMIIVDEEHEPSYKQEEKLRYHARDAAVMRARHEDIPIVLGSATPSIESWNNAKAGRYFLHEMNSRVAERQLPLIEIVNLRDERELRRDLIDDIPYWLSHRLYEEIKGALAKNEQTALFLNRRGSAQMAQCPSCGYVAECPNCSVSLTVHAASHLVCHYCGYTERKTEKCAQCPDGEVKTVGIGTELVETDLARLFPGTRIARADRDEIQSREQMEELIHDMESNKIQILIGTQMIAKGLDFPHLNLVGLLLADIGFHWPDFRASERSFQLLTQVSGRAGRHSEEPGRVVIQTFNPSHPSIQFTLQNDYTGFAEEEIGERRDCDYPPFTRIALFKVHSLKNPDAVRIVNQLAYRAQKLRELNPKFADVQVLGPAPAPLAKLRNRYRHQLMVKAPAAGVLHAFCRMLLGDEKWVPSGTKVQVDIDPLHML